MLVNLIFHLTEFDTDTTRHKYLRVIPHLFTINRNFGWISRRKYLKFNSIFITICLTNCLVIN